MGSSLSLSLVGKKYKAFTLAEILLSLTVIGIVAAIALPSLLGNVHERAFETQKKALYTRFSQALPLLPSLNGYGQLEGTLSDDENEQNVTVDTAAETFVRDGLSKVMKITNICDSEHLTDCGLPDKIVSIKENSTLELSSINTLNKFNPTMGKVTTNGLGSYEQLDTKAAAFETVNGEGILVYYNPRCQADFNELYAKAATWYYIQPKMCANFVYDLNGKKGPNTVGKDIGFISALYSTNFSVVAPNPYSTNSGNTNSITYEQAFEKCKELEGNAKLPNIDELASMFYNMRLLDITSNPYWSNLTGSKDGAWHQNFKYGYRSLDLKTKAFSVRCIKR